MRPPPNAPTTRKVVNSQSMKIKDMFIKGINDKEVTKRLIEDNSKYGFKRGNK